TTVDPPSPEYSRLQPATHKWKHKGRGLSIGLQGGIPNTINIMVQGQLTQEKAWSVYRFMPSANLKMRMEGLFRTAVFIYDDERQTAWLYPQILFMLYLLRLKVERLGHQPILDRFEFPMETIQHQF